MESMSHALGEAGPLARSLDSFTPREQQISMAESIATALEKFAVLVTEAGTGTGKTYAYMVPALLNGGKVIISTGTKTLQDQLFYRDLPSLQKALGTQAKVALLKGRSNYLCHYRMQQYGASGIVDGGQSHLLSIIDEWLTHTDSGDIAQCENIAEDAFIWPHVTSTVDNCIGADCPSYAKCFVLKARRKAQEADVVVINHHLFFIDLSLKGEGFGEILPSADAVIFDEAHQILDIARQYFGESISSRQLSELIKDAEKERQEHAADDQNITESGAKVDAALSAMKAALGNAGQRTAWRGLPNKPLVQTVLNDLRLAMKAFIKILKPVRDRSAGLDRCYERAVEFNRRLGKFDELSSDAENNKSAANGQSWVSWCETHKHRFVLHRTPIAIAETFSSHIELSHSAWIFTSATLSVGNKFNHFTKELGITDAKTALWESPFYFPEQTLLYVPENLPQPNESHYIQEAVNTAVPVIRAVGGRTFFLLTSYDAMRQVKQALEGIIPYPILVQGELPKASLLEKFRELGDAVLLGTYSFWEGVDVKGDALSCVIIDKLPFAAPGDPVMEAQRNAIAESGGNPFMDMQVPQAVIRLKQGAGRLIRDEDDIGLLMICDPRLYSKTYGRLFLRSLPDMPVTRNFDEVARFAAEKL